MWHPNDEGVEAESGQECYLKGAPGAKERACSFTSTTSGMFKDLWRLMRSSFEV